MKVLSYIGAVILFIIAAGLILFGVIFILGAFSPDGSTGWIVTGLILAGIGIALVAGGIALVYFTSRKSAAAAGNNVTVNIDLPGNVSLDSLKCKSCGGVLSKDDIKLVAGAPVVTCPFCKTTYQMTEEPKW